MYSHWGPWEHVSPIPRLPGELVFLPGFLGILKACQSSQGMGRSPKHAWEGYFWPSLHLCSGGVSDLQHFGKRLGSSELSVLLGL